MWDREVSAVEIERATGIHATTISRIIHNKHANVEMDTIDRLCIFFKCKVSDLLEFEQ